MVDPGCKIIVALDFADAGEAIGFVTQLDPGRCHVKVGKELFTHAGPRLVERLVSAGFNVFLDLKFHDIPNTVAGACAMAAELGCWMVNVHASGGRAMMLAAQERLLNYGQRPMLVAVTVLTSLSADELAEIGMCGTPAEAVTRLAVLSAECGLDGVVCSPQELTALRTALPATFKLVTPGIRPAGSAVGDQARIATPEAAVAAGASYLVIGRPITRAPDPLAALAAIEAEIARVGP